MLRKIAIWLLLIPLPLNGVWLACPESAPAQAASEQQQVEQSPDVSLFTAFSEAAPDGPLCKTICYLKAAVHNGGICLVSPGGKTSITMIAFAVAVPVPQAQLQPLVSSSQRVAEPQNFYLNPSADRSTPPPRA